MYATQTQTYHDLDLAEKVRRIKEQRRLIDAGLMEQPKPIQGFSIDDRIAMQGAMEVREFFDKFEQKYGLR